MTNKQVFIDRVIKEMRIMKPRTKLYKALKTELLALGYWKNKSRGNPQAGYKAGYGKHKGSLTI